MAVNSTIKRKTASGYEEIHPKTNTNQVEGLSTALSNVTVDNLNDISDVNAPSPSDGQALVWDNGTSKWIPGTASGGGDVQTVNSVSPDGNGNVQLTASNVGAAATSHTHAISAITNLQTSLDAKQDSLGTGTTGQFVRWGGLGVPYWDTVTASEVGAAATSHTHTIANVTGLQTAIDGKVAKAGDTMTGDLSFEKEIPRITLNMASDAAGNGGRIIFADASSVQDVQLRYNHFDSERPPFGLIVERGPGNTSTDKSYLQVQGEIYADSTQRVFHDGFHPNADTWTTARTLTIGSTGKSVNGSGNVSWSLAEIGAYAASNPSGYQTAAQVATAVSNLVDSAPATLNTLNELAAALGDDPNFATTVSNSIGTKLSLSGGTMTGVITTPNGTHGIIIGDDSRLADRNVGNTLFLEGNQNTDRGYINFSQTTGNALGAINGGDLTWRGTAVSLAGHTHSIANVTGLQTAIDGKLGTSAKAADSNLLDGIDSASFLRSDADDTMTGDLVLSNAALTYEGQGGVAVPVPQGGLYVTQTPSVTGYLKITLPVSWTNTMLSFFVDVYEYETDETFTIQLAGYNYGSAYWVNTTANLVSSSTGRLFSVHFGHDGSKCAIYVGESNSTWSYPQIRVRDVLAGYSGATVANWADGWAVGFTTTLGTITNSQGLESVVSYADSAGNANTVDGYHIVVGSTGSDASTLYFTT
jgi:hypothetical protein